MHIAALVLGIIGLLVSLVPFVGMYALPLTALALIFGLVTLKKKKGMAIAGLALGVVGSGLAGYQIYAWQEAKRAIEAGLRDGMSEESIKASLDQALKESLSQETAPTPAAKPVE